MTSKNIKKYILLHFSLLIFSLSSIISKLASNEIFLSAKYIFYICLMIFILGIYAILWQQVLKKMKLTVAFANKGVTIIWSMLIGFFFFNEKITIGNIVGSVILIIGIIMMAKEEF